ncbi:sugar ABC transporter permease [Clostridioides sp. ES-S-0108-01]|uniref:carbohydrate ABC transporter permease n=1 Tax=unclassified Clostridioides TaxID=2635829 RepID=UPI001D0C914B|nr:sugar ABC transporter permease [Clostridioides sp. ES-S-0171-01]MCC0687572.1 sugar ABC transporter permease [Clostridioides sp. ES-S-0056-01]MCC0714919.1 sugar ABC transporter permease [Clostridioides sp. ES-S-0077-01]MCC0783141.1 sugar ABC transporter permease [Clostridioides sp. ES-S-0108-01]UDN50210.1 sugar ABC transporter permease [Clostridioides sp. ES-S-0107-01]UDN53692.1 sugar ABC transporter permease [Clostridioides sp. ES-S-0054-01]
MENLVRDFEENSKRKKIKLNIKPYMYILPLGIILVSFYVLPIIMSIYFSFTKYNIISPATFIGLENYKKLFTDEILKVSIMNTIKFTVVVVPCQTILSLILAVWITGKGSSKIASFAKGAIFIPVLSSMVLIGMVWRALLNGEGSIIYQILGTFGIESSKLLGDSKTALPTLMFISMWKNIGYFMVIYISAIMNLPKHCYEVAKVDGATKFQEFIKITVPLLKPTTIMVVFLGSIWSLQVFDLVYTVTGGGPGISTMSIVMHAFNLNFKNFNSGYAMTVANVLFLLIAVVSILQNKLVKRDNSDF